MTRYERAVPAVLLLFLTLGGIVLGNRGELTLPLLNPLSLQGPWTLLLLLLAVAAGEEVAGPAAARGGRALELPLGPWTWVVHPQLWILPGALSLGFALFLPLLQDPAWLAAGMLVAALALLGTLLAQAALYDPNPRQRAWAWTYLEASGYLAVALFLVATYSFRLRSLFSATATTLLLGAVAARLLHEPDRSLRQCLLMGGTVGLAVGEVLWALNYWPIPGLRGGIVLFFCFHAFLNLLRREGRRAAGESLAFLVLALLLLLSGLPGWGLS